MRDSNGNIIEKGMNVITPDPNDTDNYLHSFAGFVSGFRNSYVIVVDGESNSFEIEPERLTIE